MPAQVSVLARKTFISNGDFSWYSEPMYWGGFQKAEIFLEVHGMHNVGDYSLVFEGATNAGENANWTTIAAGTPADPSALSAKGVNRYVREDLYPYVRIKLVCANTTGGNAAAEVTVNGQLHDEV